MELTLEEFQRKLPELKEPAPRIRFIQEFLWTAYDLYPKETAAYAEEAYNLSIDTNDRWGVAYGNMNKAYYGLFISNDRDTFKYFHTALEIFREIGDKEGEARSMNMMSYSLWWEGKYDKAFELAFQSLRIAEEGNTPDGQGWSNYSLGVFYYDLKDYALSEKYYKRAHEFFEKGTNRTYSVSRCHSGLASVMIALGDYAKAVEYIEVAVQGYKKLRNSIGMARSLNDMGVVLRMQGLYNEAEEKLLESLELRKRSNYLQGITTTSFELGNLYMLMGKYDIALEYLFKALELAETSKTRPKIYQIHELLGEVYKRRKDFEKALLHKEKFFTVKSEVSGEQATNKLKDLQTQFATEKSEKETEIHRLKNVELKKAYAEIEEKNKSILDSINYAKRIQEAILPSEEEFRTLLPGSFVLYKPKDVVSGDFYWIMKKDNKVFFAAVDCTGHGVPGALMSMIGNTLLNEIVNDKGITKPSLILDALTESVIRALKQTGAEGENKDGMDIAVCVIENNKLEFAGANNPLWIVKGSGFFEIKGDKQPVGISFSGTKLFTNHVVDLLPGDRIYVFTDGYADQFGGEKGKKYKYKQLQEKLISSAGISMKDQRKMLDDDFEIWKNALEQVDDVLIIGVEVH